MLNSSGWSAFDKNREHLAVEIEFRVFGRDEARQLMQPFFVIKKLPALCKMLAKILVNQTEFLQDDGSAVCPETATVQTHVQQPVVFVVRLLSR